MATAQPAAGTGTEPMSLRTAVKDLLWPVVVLSKGSPNFGLEQRTLLRSTSDQNGVDTDNHEIGGWLRKVRHRHSSSGRAFGEAQYFVLDDVKQQISLIKQDEVKDYFRFQKIVSVTAHCENGGRTYFFRLVAVVSGEQKIWELSPADTSDRNVVLAWTAALQIRSKTYDVLLDLDREKALKVALWCQSLYRGFRGRIRAERKRARKEKAKAARPSGFGIHRMVSGLLFTPAPTTQPATTTTTTPSTSAASARIDQVSDSSSEEDDGDNECDDEDDDRLSSVPSSDANQLDKNKLQQSKTLTHAISSFKRGLFKNQAARASMDQQGESEELDNSAATALNGGKKVQFPSDRSLVKSASQLDSLPPKSPPMASTGTQLEPIVVEDEIWENQRWSAMAMRGTQVYRGWSDVALLPAERGPFSDRLGTLSWPSLDSIPCPRGWKITKNWTLDLSSNKCNSEGWTYAQTFPAIDSNLASGRSNFSASARWLVRRRRYYRVREKEGGAQAADAVQHAGWLGMRGIATGRWLNCYTFLPRERTKDHLGVALCYFKKRVSVFNEDLSFRYDFNRLNASKVKVKFLDNLCVVSDACATRDQPGLFSLHLCGEAEPRLFNAHSAEARARWVQVLSQAIAESPGPCYESIANRRSMRKGAAWELLRASEAVKDLVGGGVRGVKMGFHAIKRGAGAGGGGHEGLQRGGSDPDMNAIQSLREEYRRNDAVWTGAVTRARKFSTDSLGSIEIPLVPVTNKRSVSTPQSPTRRLETIPAAPSGDEDVAASQLQQQSVVSDDEVVKKSTRIMKEFVKLISKPGQIRTSPALNPINIPPASPSGPSSSGFDEVSPTLSSSDDPINNAVIPCVPGAVAFEMPPPFDNIVFDGHFDVSVDDFDTLFFREEEFTRDILAAEKMFDVELEPWTNGIAVGSEHRRRYKMPRVGIVPPGPSFHLLTRTQTCPGKGFVIDQVCSTPEMPYGTAFSVDFRNVFIQDGPKRCRVIISQRVTLLRPVMAQSFIKGGTKREVAAYYKNVWPQFVRKWIAEKRSHLLSKDAVIEALPPTASTSEDNGQAMPGAVENAASAPPSTAVTSSNFGSRVEILLILLLVVVVLVLAWQVIMLSSRLSRMEDLLLSLQSQRAETQ